MGNLTLGLIYMRKSFSRRAHAFALTYSGRASKERKDGQIFRVIILNLLCDIKYSRVLEGEIGQVEETNLLYVDYNDVII